MRDLIKLNNTKFDINIYIRDEYIIIIFSQPKCSSLAVTAEKDCYSILPGLEVFFLQYQSEPKFVMPCAWAHFGIDQKTPTYPGILAMHTSAKQLSNLEMFIKAASNI